MFNIKRHGIAVVLPIAIAVWATNANATLLDFEGIAPSGSFTTYNTFTLSHNGFDITFFHGHIIDSSYLPNFYNNHNATNGTDWLMHDTTGILRLEEGGGAAFSLSSLLYQSYSNGNSNVTITGYFSGGGSILDSITMIPGWQTKIFSASWSNLDYVTFQGSTPNNTFDDIVLNAAQTRIPEPATIALLGLGLAGLGFARRKKA